ncbi:TonB-dependent receptor [Pollutimonas bauzanensis]|uniref:TonB-dependent receptor n=1 Tax=Pollutimonas bauzanensis TaxID=658167 RepID=UPI0015B415C3|nr:TonB-dependent receptor [Pollutimonas bauzanensis]
MNHKTSSVRAQGRQRRSAFSGNPGILALSLALACALPAPRAQAQEAAVQISVPAQPLGSALVQLANQAALELIYSPDIVAGLTAPAVSGRITPDQALRALLAGTGIEFRRNGKNVSLSRSGSLTQLEAIKVVGSTGSLPPAYAGGQVARGGQLGLLGNKDFMDTPFNVASFTAEGIRNQQARSIGDVVKNDPSVRTTWPDGSYVSQFTIRGFPTQTQDIAVNGVYGIVPPQMAGGLESIERVEILKGPSALMNGMAPSGGVGGNINLVTKRATDEPITQLTANYYSNAQFGGQVDLGRRFGENGEWGVRLNGAYRDGKTGIDDQAQRAGSVALGLDYRGEGLRLSADVGYHDVYTDSPTRVVYTDSENFQIPKAPDSTLNIGQPWYFAQSRDHYALIQGEVDIGPDWTAYAAAGGRKNEFLGLYNFIYLQDDLGNFRANQYYQPTYSDTKTGLLGLRGSFATGAVRHELNLSVTTVRTDSGAVAPVVSTYRSNIYDPATISPPSLAGYSDTAPKTAESNLTSLALADTLHFLDDKVQLTLGARQQRVVVKNFNAATGAQTSFYDKERVTPAAGLVIRPFEDTSFYANYIEGLSQGPTAPVSASNAGTLFEPIKSRQYEVGVKHDFGQFAATVSAFQIEQPSGYTDAATNTYGLNGEQRNRGIEINVFGEPWRGIRTLGGAAFTQGTLTKTANGAFDGNKAVGVPATQLNLGGEWDTPFLAGLTLTGRVIYTSSQYYNASNSQDIPAWTRVDIGARYKTKVSGVPVTIRAGIENLLDKDYWAAASSSFGLARGAPRTFLLSTTMEF